MLGSLRDDRQVALFAAATRLNEIFIFLPTVISQTVFPMLRGLHRRDRAAFDDFISAGMCVLFWVSLVYSILVSAFSGTIITVLYGEDYRAAAPVLSIYIFASVIIAMSVFFQTKYLFDDLLKVSLYGTISGALFNISANLSLSRATVRRAPLLAA